MEATLLESIRKCIGVTPTEVPENGVLVPKDMQELDEVVAEKVASTVNMLRNGRHSTVVNTTVSEDWKFTTAMELVLLLNQLPGTVKTESIKMVARKLSVLYTGKLGPKADRPARFDAKSKSRGPEKVKLDGLFLGYEKVYQRDKHGKICTDAAGNKIKRGYGYEWTLPDEDADCESQKASIIKNNARPRLADEKNDELETPRVVKFLDTDEVQKRILDNDEAHTAKRICTRQVDDGVAVLVPPSPVPVSHSICLKLEFDDGNTVNANLEPGEMFGIGRGAIPEGKYGHVFYHEDSTICRKVSVKHCNFTIANGGVQLEDTSTNGTWIGAKENRINKATTIIKDGDRVFLYWHITDLTGKQIDDCAKFTVRLCAS